MNAHDLGVELLVHLGVGEGALQDVEGELGAGLDGEVGESAAGDFADQAHLTRAARAETGRTPAALRRLLAG